MKFPAEPFVNMASSDSCLIHFDGNKGPLTSLRAVSYQKLLDCRRIWLILDGEDCNLLATAWKVAGLKLSKYFQNIFHGSKS